MNKDKLEVGNKALVFVGKKQHSVEVVGVRGRYVILVPLSPTSTYGGDKITKQDCDKYGVDPKYIDRTYGLYHQELRSRIDKFDWIPPTSVSR